MLYYNIIKLLDYKIYHGVFSNTLTILFIEDKFYNEAKKNSVNVNCKNVFACRHKRTNQLSL